MILRAGRRAQIKCLATLSIVGDHGRAGDPAYLGHFANDGASLASAGDDDAAHDAAREAYARDTASLANAKHEAVQGCHLATVALRDIPAGGEVLVSYGEGNARSRRDARARLSRRASACVSRVFGRQSSSAVAHGAQPRQMLLFSGASVTSPAACATQGSGSARAPSTSGATRRLSSRSASPPTLLWDDDDDDGGWRTRRPPHDGRTEPNRLA